MIVKLKIEIKNMKKIVSLLLLTVMALSFSNCSEDAYDSRYVDPSKVTEANVPGLFTGVLMRCLDYSNYGYFRFFAVDSQFTGKYAQTFGNAGGYAPGYEGYVNSLMNSVYFAMSDYVKMLDMLSAMNQETQEVYKAYRYGAMVHLYDFFLASVDMYGDLPFSEACKLPITSDIIASQAPYDKAEDIYSTILDELKIAGEEFSDLLLTQQKHKNWNQNDVLNKGDYKKWQLYANSLRLRAAVRAAQHGPITAKAQSVIKEILENPDKYPVLETNSTDEMPFLRNDHDGSLNFEGGGGLGDWVQCRYASAAIVDRMLSGGNWRKDAAGNHIAGTGSFVPGTDDPRILLLYTMCKQGVRKADGTWTGINTRYNYTTIVSDKYPSPTAALSEKKWNDSIYFSGVDMGEIANDPNYYDPVSTSEIIEGGFFWQNKNFEHVQMTASEVLFCKAEAYQRGWGVAKNEAKAKEAFVDGVKKSIELYYHWNEVNNNASTELLKTDDTFKDEILNDATITAFAEARWNSSINPSMPYGQSGESDPHVEAILTQKYLHWSVFMSRQAWAQVRRTGIPKLVFPKKPSDPEYAPDRWLYQASERYYNPNYPAEYDQYDTKLFWADPRGMRRSTYSGGVWSDQY
jgi:hypothetical protein